MRVELALCEKVLLREISDPTFTRDDVAKTYGLAIKSSESVDWRKVNEAIMGRWSRSALEYIKRRAWKP